MQRPTPAATATVAPLSRTLLALLAAAAAAAAPGCGGRSILATGDGGPDSAGDGGPGSDGGPGPDGGPACGGRIACQLDSDCLPPLLICSGDSCCTQGCSTTGCAAGLTCAATGHCIPTIGPGGGGSDGGPGGGGSDGGPGGGGSDGGPGGGGSDGGPGGGGSDGGPGGGGSDGGPGGGGSDGGPGVPSATLCHACTSNADCAGGGLCLNDPTSGRHYCAQDCSSAPCPDGYFCLGGGLNQCLAPPGACPSLFPLPDGGLTDAGPPDAGPDGGPHGDGGVLDGGVFDGGPAPDAGGESSGNPNGCGHCQPCSLAEDCKSGSTCIAGRCFTFCFGRGIVGQFFCQNTPGPPSSCHGYPVDTTGSFDPGYCLTANFDCTPPDGGSPPACVPAAVNPQCAPETIPAAGFGNQALLGGAPATNAALVRTSGGNLVAAVEGGLADGGSEIRVLFSDDNGAHWADRGAVSHPHRNPRGPRLAVTRASIATPALEQVHLAFTADATLASGDGGTVEGTVIDYTVSSTAAHFDPAAAVTTEVSDADTPGLAGATSALVPGMGELALTYTTSAGVKIRTRTAYRGFNDPVLVTTDSTGISTPAYRSGADGRLLVAVVASPTVKAYGSDDSGATWSAGTTVSSGLSAGSEPASVAADGSDHAWVGFAAANVSSSGSSDGYWMPTVAALDVGSKTPALLRVRSVADDTAGCWQHRRVSLATDGTNLLAAFHDDRAGGRGNLWLVHSTDQGQTWSGSRRVNAQDFVFDWSASAGPRALAAPGLAAAGGNVFLLWSDPRDGLASRPFSAAGPW